MTINYIDEFEFPSDFGFTKSSGPVKMNRGGMKNIRQEEARVIGVQDNAADEKRRVESLGQMMLLSAWTKERK